MTPMPANGLAREGNAVVRAQLVNLFRRAVTGQIGWAGVHGVSYCAEPDRKDGSVRPFADARSEINVIVEQVADSTCAREPNVWIGVQTVADDGQQNGGQDLETAENDRHGVSEIALRQAIFAGGLAFCFAQAYGDEPAGGIASVGAGEGQAPAGEAGLQVGFARTDCFHKDRCGSEAVHLFFQNSEE
jgi:hypothetical protein